MIDIVAVEILGDEAKNVPFLHELVRENDDRMKKQTETSLASPNRGLIPLF